uniref:Uncharacterized protein n=1 Tax=Solanum tuberosum TaxID=4113 RepID=M1BMA5_SOLTU
MTSTLQLIFGDINYSTSFSHKSVSEKRIVSLIEKDGYQWRNMNAEMVTWTELEPEYLTNSSDE